MNAQNRVNICSMLAWSACLLILLRSKSVFAQLTFY